jgi:hypothetical protein
MMRLRLPTYQYPPIPAAASESGQTWVMDTTSAHRQKGDSAMGTTEPAPSAQPPPYSAQKSRNGFGIAALVIGVASLVAVISFVLFPLGLLGGLIGLILGIVALTGGKARGATNGGQAVAGLICCVLALVLGIVLSVRVGTWAARNSSVFTRFDNCIVKAGDRAAVADCISRFANDVRS